MSTVLEIEEAIARLSPEEREALESRLFSKYNLDVLSLAQRTELFASLDQADAEIERGAGLTPAQMRDAVREWTGK